MHSSLVFLAPSMSDLYLNSAKELLNRVSSIFLSLLTVYKFLSFFLKIPSILSILDVRLFFCEIHILLDRFVASFYRFTGVYAFLIINFFALIYRFISVYYFFASNYRFTGV